MHRVEAKGLLSASNGFNLYRGCTHGCIYCDSRSACYRMEHDFEDVEVKANAPELLQKALRAKRAPCMLGTGSMSDPYLPLEGELRLTRRCLEVIAGQGFGVSVLTKSNLVLRDFDLLEKIHCESKCVVQLTLTTAEEKLCRVLEPRVCPTGKRLEVLRECKRLGLPTVVWLSPILPFLNDTEANLRALLDGCAEAGVRGIICFGFGMTLREGNREYFYRKLDEHFPGMKEEYIRRFGLQYEIPSPNHQKLWEIFTDFCDKHAIAHDANGLFAYLHEFPRRQVSLFDEGILP